MVTLKKNLTKISSNDLYPIRVAFIIIELGRYSDDARDVVNNERVQRSLLDGVFNLRVDPAVHVAGSHLDHFSACKDDLQVLEEKGEGPR